MNRVVEYIEREAYIKMVKDIPMWGSVAAMMADCIPAADVVEVVHGKWEFKHPNGWACSKCGEWGLMIDNRGICKSNYCPNCGARMDGGCR